MPGLLENDLDAFSRLTVPLVLARFPEWENLAALTASDSGPDYVVEFNVPCPSPAVDRGLWVSTANEELTVGFHTHHGHGRYGSEVSHREQVRRALQYAGDFIDERAGVVSWYGRGGEVGVTYSVELPCADLAAFSGLDRLGWESVTSFVAALGKRRLVTLRSWNGRFDRDERRR